MILPADKVMKKNKITWPKSFGWTKEKNGL